MKTLPHPESQPHVATAGGFATHVLRTREVEIRVVPALGAKITSLRDLRSGREWLWSAPDGRGLRENRPGDAFEAGSMAGIDECVPTVAPCRLGDQMLPDHGEAWACAWTVNNPMLEEDAGTRGRGDAGAHGRGDTGTRGRGDAGTRVIGRECLHTSLDLACLPLRIERELTLDGAVLTFRYCVTNLSALPQPDFWSLHPLFARHEGDRIELPSDVGAVKIDSQLGLGLAVGTAVPWPCPNAGVNFSTMTSSTDAPWYAKLFVTNPNSNRAAIVNDLTGDRLDIDFDSEPLLHLGIWITRGGWNGFDHFALEPTTHASDTPISPDNVVRDMLLPHASRTWQVRFSLSAGQPLN